MSVSQINEAFNWNITRIANAFNFHRDTVRKKIKAAGLKPDGRQGNAELYQLAKVAPVLFSAPEKARGKLEYVPEELWPKDRKEWFQSESERIKFQANIGELIPVDKHREALLITVKSVVAFFESLPDKMERRRSFTPEQLEELERVTDAFRAELYEQLLVIKEAEKK